jgi:hypothetical protein
LSGQNYTTFFSSNIVNFGDWFEAK